MYALSVRQPWASLIVKAGKDIENRSWPLKYRGRLLVHAAKGCTRAEWDDAIEFAQVVLGQRITSDLKTIPRGGLIGSVEIVDCVRSSASPWFVGKYGFVLRNPLPLTFRQWTGELGLFRVPRYALSEAEELAHGFTNEHVVT